jgi:hypothetical protein
MKTFTAYRPLQGKHMPHQLNAPDMPQYQGVVFDDGSVAIRWLTAKKSTSVWDCLADCLDIHGHAEYGTYLVWGDGRVENYIGEGKFETRPVTAGEIITKMEQAQA